MTCCIFYGADTKPLADLESIFFDLETEMENNMCRDMICMSEESERRKIYFVHFNLEWKWILYTGLTDDKMFINMTWQHK